MMAEFRQIQMSLFLVMLLQFTAAENHLPSVTVRVGEEVTLPCANVIQNQDNCDSTTWLFSNSSDTAAVELITLGKIHREAKAKSDRLSFTENCSLVIKKVTREDVGRYDCQQYDSRHKQVSDSDVHLSVVTMTEQKDTDVVTLTCSVKIYKRCPHTVKWLFQGQDVDKDNKDIKTSQSLCSASVTFLTSVYIYTSRYKLFKCAVTDGDRVQVFPFRSQSSGEKPGEDTTTATTASTTAENNTTAGASDPSSKPQDSWVYIIVAVALAALLILIVAIIVWRRTKGNKTQMSDTIGLTSNPAVTQAAPEPSQGTADPEDGVSYASISYTKKTNSKAQVLFKDEDDAVTYSTVKASSSSAGASADLTNLYATINKPNKFEHQNKRKKKQRDRIMMAEFRQIQMSLFLVTLLQFTAAAENHLPSVTVRIGDEVTLPCDMIEDQDNCNSATWLFTDTRHTATVELVTHGKIHKEAKDKSDRLSVTEKCSLVIKKVTDEDAGQYTCRQFNESGQQQDQDSVVHLSVVTMTEHNNTNEVTLNCSVRTYERCRHTVKWLFQGQDVDKDNKDIKTSQSLCSASVTFLTSLYIYTSRYKLFTCEVTDGDRVQVFPFRSQSSGEKPDSWVYIIVAVALAALLILIVAIIVWRRTKGNKTQMSDTIGLTSNPAVTQAAPEPSQGTTDPEDGVSYASISYTKKTNSKAQVLFKDEDDAVTYSTVKASSSSSAGASADLTNLYATINKPNK
ncbi:uncharacterized protein LOC144466593 [Epinephelus lanceolatus]